MEDKQCKQTERFSVMAKASEYFLSLDCKCKGMGMILIQKRKNFQTILVNFHQCSDVASLLQLITFYFSLSPLTKEVLEAYESLESYNQFASRWVKELKIKLFLITCCSYLGYWTSQYVMYFLPHSTIRYKLSALCLLLRLKSRSTKGASTHPAFMGNCSTINHKCYPYLPRR